MKSGQTFLPEMHISRDLAYTPISPCEKRALYGAEDNVVASGQEGENKYCSLYSVLLQGFLTKSDVFARVLAT